MLFIHHIMTVKKQCIVENCNGKQCDESEYCKKHYKISIKENAEKDGKKMCRNYVRGCLSVLSNDYTQLTCEKCLEKRKKKTNDFKKCFKCENRCIEEQEYCMRHKILYDKEQIEKNGKKMCKNYDRGCVNILPEKYNFLTCSECLKKNKPKNIIKCKYVNCKYKKSDENDYCGKHQKEYFKEQIEKENKKVCMNYLRGCKNKLSLNYQYKKCEECLKKERDKDNNRRNNKPINITNIDEINEYCEKNNIINDENEEIQYCNSCSIGYTKSNFISNEINTVTCSKCRNNNKIQDAKRDKEHVNELSRINGQKEERKIVKKEWKENNYEKCVGYWIKYRGKKMTEENSNYWIKTNEKTKEWRKNNPEEVKKHNENMLTNMNKKLTTYKNSARIKGLIFSLTDDETINLIKNKCHYCNIFGEYDITGIDRINSCQGYTKENTVSCCSMCNYMKGCLTDYVFIKKNEHILTYQKIKNGQLNNNLFGNHITEGYNYYENRAKHKDIDFTLSKDECEKLINGNCFMCGKQSNENNTNGIDKFDNTEGYTLENTNSCCFECNILKKNYVYDDLVKKMIEIYENTVNYIYTDINITNTCLIVRNENKLSKKEIKEQFKVKMENQRKNTINNNTDINIINERIKKLSEKRKTKK
jgi:hypothetical protein